MVDYGSAAVLATIGGTKNEMNEPENVLVECPGCSLFLPTEEQCARHLLLECLSPRNLNDSETLRSKFSQWLIRYFYSHFIKRVINIKIEKMSCRRAPEEKYVESVLQVVKLPGISFDLQCPVCQKYFCSHKACSEHLFKNCLRTKNSESAISILDWFSDYLWTNSKSKLDCFTDLKLFHRTERRICMYCKKEFFDKECLLRHFRSFHPREKNAGDSLCRLCNFKPGNDRELFKHLIRAHVKCGCQEKQKDFATLKTHLSGCLKSDGCLCPMCREVRIQSYETESEFERHILNCRKSVPLKLSLHDLYTECDICWQLILKCNLDIHVAEHIKSMDAVGRRPTNIFVNLDDLKDILSEEDVLKMKQLLEQPLHTVPINE